MPDHDERQQQILDAAAAIIIRLGYDKTTMSDIAAEAGTSRGTVYLYFKGKEELFEALLYREYLQYAQIWLETLEADPRGGTIGGCYRATVRAVKRRPLIAALLRRDRRVIGSYLRKRDNLFTQMLAEVNPTAFFEALQAAGAIRQDIDAAVIVHILEMLSYGQLTIGDFKPPDQSPPDEVVMETLADLMDRALLPAVTPENKTEASTASRDIFRQITAAARATLAQIKQERERSSQVIAENLTNGVTHDNG